MFASYGVQSYGGRLKRCNDKVYKVNRTACTGMFFKKIKVTDMNIDDGEDVGFMVPRVWYVNTACLHSISHLLC